MTKKDFKKIAAVCKAWKPFVSNEALTSPEYSQWTRMVEGLAIMLGKENKRFDYDKFYCACGLYDAEPDPASQPD